MKIEELIDRGDETGQRIRETLNVLLESPYFYKTDDERLFLVLTRYKRAFEAFFDKFFGWTLVMDSKCARLYKPKWFNEKITPPNRDMFGFTKRDECMAFLILIEFFERECREQGVTADRATVAERVAAIAGKRPGLKSVAGAAGGKLRILVFKNERMVELESPGWKEPRKYPMTGFSGRLGPKLREGDCQIPEGVYGIEYLNPNSLFHLSLKVSYPNADDKARAKADGRTDLGGDIMIHGGSAADGRGRPDRTRPGGRAAKVPQMRMLQMADDSLLRLRGIRYIITPQHQDRLECMP